MFQLAVWPYLYRFNRLFQPIETANPWAESRTHKIGILNNEVIKLKEKIKQLEAQKNEFPLKPPAPETMIDLPPPPPPPRVSVDSLPPPPPPSDFPTR